REPEHTWAVYQVYGEEEANSTQMTIPRASSAPAPNPFPQSAQLSSRLSLPTGHRCRIRDFSELPQKPAKLPEKRLWWQGLVESSSGRWLHVLNRRNFLKAAGSMTAGSLAAMGAPAALAQARIGNGKTFMLEPQESEPQRPISANDHIQIALIGAGGQGQFDTKTAVQVPGVKLVAVADCYNGRLEHSKEIWGQDTFTTRDYAEVLARKDIDAVIIGTPDHWHKQAAVDAM